MEFDGIDLEDLANSESPFMEGKVSTGSDDDLKDKDEDSLGKDLGFVEEGFDMDFIANSGSTEDIDAEDKQEVVKKTKSSPDNTVATSSSQTFTSLATALKEGGTFNSLTDEELAEITDVSSLLSAFDKQVKNNEFSNLTDHQKDYLNALAAGTPHEVFAQAKSNSEQYTNITDDSLENKPALQEELIKRSFLIKGFTLEQAAKYSALAMKGDDPVEESKEARSSLIAYEEDKISADINTRKQSQIEAKAKADKDLSDLKSKLTDSTEVIPGIKVNSTTRDKIFNSMTTPTKVNDGIPLNEVMEKYSNDPEYKMKLHALDVITKGFKDFSVFTKASTSSAAKKFEEQLNNSAGNIIHGNNMRTSTVVSTSQSEIAKQLANLKL